MPKSVLALRKELAQANATAEEQATKINSQAMKINRLSLDVQHLTEIIRERDIRYARLQGWVDCAREITGMKATEKPNITVRPTPTRLPDVEANG